MTTPTSPSATILVLNWNGSELLPRALPALFSLEHDDYQVVIADNGSTDDSLAYVKANYPQAGIIDLGQNLGFCRGYNAAVQRLQSAGEILVLLNNDVIVRPNWLTALLAPFADPSVGITGCKLYFADGQTLQHAGAELSYPVAYSQHYFYREVDRGQADQLRQVPYVTGAALAIRHDLALQMGPFDETFAPFYFEEADLCYRAREAGYQVLYVPEAQAIHLEGLSFERTRASQHFYFQRNRLRFVLKHYDQSQFLDDFVPAEVERLRATPASAEDLAVIRRAYLEAMLSLPELPDRPGDGGERDDVRLALERLLQVTLEIEPIKRPSPADESPQNRLATLQEIREHEFKSDRPVAGPAIAAFRRAWSDVAARWAVQTAVEQQNRFNAEVAHLLAEQARLLEDRQAETRANAQDLATLAAELVATNQALGAIAARLEELSEQVARLAERLEQTQDRPSQSE